jgi:Predicted nucleotide-binding protein containing TIR-like domain
MSQATPEKPGTWQARVFLAYASEDRDVALAVQEAIKRYAKGKEGKIDVDPWEVNSELSESILDNIQFTMRERDFGVFIYSPVDGKARDNVVFETGLFIGMKKADHAIILLPENYEVEPSDLHGILGPPYPYDEVLAAKDHPTRVAKMGAAGATIVDRIRNIMTQPPAYQEQPEARLPQSGARTEQPPTAAETLSTVLAFQAGQRKLTPLGEDVLAGRIVVHATCGIGRVLGFDPEGVEPRYVEVQFGSGIGRYKLAELFEAPIEL